MPDPRRTRNDPPNTLITIFVDKAADGTKKIRVDDNRHQNGNPNLGAVGHGKKVEWEGDPGTVERWVVGFDFPQGNSKKNPFDKKKDSDSVIFGGVTSATNQVKRRAGEKIKTSGPGNRDSFNYWIMVVDKEGEAIYEDPIIVIDNSIP